MIYEQWIKEQEKLAAEEYKAESEKNSRVNKTMRNLLGDIRWKLTGPEEDYERWLRYCGEHGIIVKKKAPSPGAKYSGNHEAWKRARGLTSFSFDLSGETLLVPNDFILKCITLEGIPPEIMPDDDQ
jgi:hypothetical protein